MELGHIESVARKSNTASLALLNPKPAKRLHAESLLKLPLVQQMLNDPTTRLSPRCVDQNWIYQKTIPNPIVGFNPYAGEIHYASKSCFANWLKAPHQSARDFNVNDNLMLEVFVATHDYLHIWAVQAIQTMAPELNFGFEPITAKNIERHVFCHLLTETAAVVGLDYWFLSNLSINKTCDIGTKITQFATAYHESDAPEYRRFYPEFNAQDPNFFSALVKFYCTGEFIGIDVNDMRRSPKLIGWLNHELKYGVNQRNYTRSWLAYLSDREIEITFKDQEVVCDQKWQIKLTKELGTLLWEKVKENKIHRFPKRNKKMYWQAPASKELDFRFTNLNTISLGTELRYSLGNCASFEFFFYQWLSAHDFESFDVEFFKLFPEFIQKRDLSLIEKVLSGLRHLPQMRNTENRDIFILP